MPSLVVAFDINGVMRDLPMLIADVKPAFRQKLSTALSAMNGAVPTTVLALECLYAALLQDGVIDPAQVAEVATMTGRLAYLVTFGGWMGDLGMPQRAADILTAMRQIVEEGKAVADAGGPAVGASYAPAPVVPDLPGATT